MTLSSKIDTKNSVFKENAAAMQVHIDQMVSQEARIKLGGSDKAKARQKQLGKLLVRERIAKLIDPNTDFFELSIMAGFQLYQDNLPAAGIITGIGIINGTHCMIIANDPDSIISICFVAINHMTLAVKSFVLKACRIIYTC